MGHGRHVTGSSYPAPAAPAPVADYNVTAENVLAPDCSCNYFLAGTYNEHPYYRRSDGAYFLFYTYDFSLWVIAVILGDVEHGFWVAYEEPILGLYQPMHDFSGRAIVSAGPH